MSETNREVSAKFIIPTVFAIALFILPDQISKIYVVSHNISYVCNRGFAFGMESLGFGLVISLLVLLSVGYFLFREMGREQNSNRIFGLSLVMGGGLSNIVDRLIRGCVVDFINLKIWPAFNLADAAITIGVVILILSLFKTSKSPQV